MTTCPTTGDLVPTGYRTGDLNLATMFGAYAFRCSNCEQVHSWTAEAAVTEPLTPRLGAAA